MKELALAFERDFERDFERVDALVLRVKGTMKPNVVS